MKAEDLMIGDWVNLNFDVDYKTGNPIYGYVQVTGVNKDGTIDVNCTFDKSESMQDGWDLKLIEPIPITHEILEKNRFYNSDLVDDYFIVHGIHYNVNSKYIMFGYEYVKVLEVRCEYVHELQHALKLCKIEKEIIL